MPQHALNWDESKHPRDEDGEFTSKAGGQSPRSIAAAKKELKQLSKEHADRFGGTKMFTMSPADRPAAMKESQALLERINQLHGEIVGRESAVAQPQGVTYLAAVPRQESGMQVTPGPVAPPPRQTLMFDANATKRLFEGALFEAAKSIKKTAKPAVGPSLLETIEDDLGKQAAASKPIGGQREMFSRMVERYANRALHAFPPHPDDWKGRWVTMHGAHVFIKNGKIADPPASPPKIPLEKIPQDASSPQRQYNPEWLLPSLDNIRAKTVDIPDDIWFAEWEGELGKTGELAQQLQPLPRFRTAVKQAAQSAADAVGAPYQDVLHLMPEAHKFLKQQQEDREKAKASLRKVSGLNAGSLARMENQYQDHSMLKNWDTTSREFSMNWPDLGYDPGGDDTPAAVWNFLREGKAPYLPAHDPSVAELAAEWARPKSKPNERVAGDDEEDAYHHVDPARSGDAVPFSRRPTLVEKFSRHFEKSLRLLLTGF